MYPGVPAIYSPRYEIQPLSLGQRLSALLISCACLALLITAARLEPSPTGIGTHTQLGLEACAFEARTGIPCPSCGMTTSFAWFARGNFAASIYNQPMGALLALLTVIAFWTGLYVSISGRPAHRLIWLIPSRYYVVSLLSWAIIAWAWKIFIHLHGIDGWPA
jgi:hypothetical protein